jgi:hypothetical protein
MSTSPAPISSAAIRLFEAVKAAVGRSDVFGAVEVKKAGASASTNPPMLVAAAKDSAEPAEYRLFEDSGKLWVALVTDNRWLSQSIEAHLVNTGDKLEELLDEELYDVGYEGATLTFEHFRDAAKLYTFRSPLPFGADAPDAAGLAAKCLLAYEACFRRLGDMDASDEDE